MLSVLLLQKVEAAAYSRHGENSLLVEEEGPPCFQTQQQQAFLGAWKGSLDEQVAAAAWGVNG